MKTVMYFLFTFVIVSTGYSQRADMYVDQGRAKAHAQDYSGAIIEYNRTLEVSPNYADAYFYKGTVFLCDTRLSMVLRRK